MVVVLGFKELPLATLGEEQEGEHDMACSQEAAADCRAWPGRGGTRRHLSQIASGCSESASRHVHAASSRKEMYKCKSGNKWFICSDECRKTKQQPKWGLSVHVTSQSSGL